MFKSGTTREDGKVFFRYGKHNGVWLDKKVYDKRIEKRRAYQRNCYRLYKSMRKIKRRFGEYCSKRNLYFYGISASGKEVWKEKDKIIKLKDRQKIYRKTFFLKCKKDPITNLKFKDRHPDDPNLFVLYKRGNRLYFGNAKQLELRKQRLRQVYKRRNEKYRIIRARKLVQRKYKRGDKNPKNNTVFWYYSKRGNEIWLSPEEFTFRHAKDKQQQINYHKRKNEKLNKDINISCS